VTLALTGDTEADKLLSSNPFALLVGMTLDQQVPFERAFSAPKELRDRLGGSLDAKTVASLPPDRLAAVFAEKPALHRFPSTMAGRVHELARVVVEDFGGDASAVWKSAQTGEDLVSSLTRLPGFGKYKAKVFTALLGKRFDVRPPGWIEASAPYGEPGITMSVADIDSPEAHDAVRDHKRQMKAAAKSLAALSGRPKAGRSKKR